MKKFNFEHLTPILITGGAGYIGSHTLVELANSNHDFIVYDNLSNSSRESLHRVENIINKSITFINGDIRDKAKLKETFQKYQIDSVIHFAGLKAVGKREYLQIFGDDYDTPDGTGVRDYIHVVDLANANVKAIDYMNSNKFKNDHMIFNIGTGHGYSVIEMVKTYEKASGKKIPYKITNRRDGDIAKCYGDPTLAKEILEWKATRDLETMCRDSWKCARE